MGENVHKTPEGDRLEAEGPGSGEVEWDEPGELEGEEAEEGGPVVLGRTGGVPVRRVLEARGAKAVRAVTELREVPEDLAEEAGLEEVVLLGVDQKEIRSPKRPVRQSPSKPARLTREGEVPGGMEFLPDVATGLEEREVAAEDPEAEWELDKMRQRPQPLGWVVLLLVFVSGLLLVAFWRIPKGDRKLDRTQEVMEEKLEALERETKDAEVLSDRIGKVSRAYLEAGTIEEKLKYVRMPERVRPLMERYYAKYPMRAAKTEGFFTFEPLALESYPFVVVRVKLVGEDAALFLMEDAGGVFKVDWESHVAYQPMALADYLEKKPTEGMIFRLNVAYDGFYAFEFADNTKWVSLFLSERDSEEFLFGYVERDGEAHKELEKQLGLGGKTVVPALLEVRFLPGSAGTRSVLVERVVAPGWAYRTNPDGEG